MRLARDPIVLAPMTVGGTVGGWNEVVGGLFALGLLLVPGCFNESLPPVVEGHESGSTGADDGGATDGTVMTSTISAGLPTATSSTGHEERGTLDETGAESTGYGSTGVQGSGDTTAASESGSESSTGELEGCPCPGAAVLCESFEDGWDESAWTPITLGTLEPQVTKDRAVCGDASYALPVAEGEFYTATTHELEGLAADHRVHLGLRGIHRRRLPGLATAADRGVYL